MRDGDLAIQLLKEGKHLYREICFSDIFGMDDFYYVDGKRASEEIEDSMLDIILEEKLYPEVKVIWKDVNSIQSIETIKLKEETK